MNKPVKVLVDTNIRSYAVRTEWWRDNSTQPNPAVFLKSKPRPDDELAAEIECLPTIAELVKQGEIELFTYPGLWVEHSLATSASSRLPVGDIFSDIEFSWIKFPVALPRWFEFKTTKTSNGNPSFHGSIVILIEYFISQNNDHSKKLKLICDKLIKKHYTDAFHLWVSMENNLDFFLTCDNKIVNVIRNTNLNAKGFIIKPTEFMKLINKAPTEPMPVEYDAVYMLNGRRID